MCGFVFCGTAIIVFYNTLQFITFPKAMNTHFYFSISLLVPIFTYLGGLFLFLFFSSNQNNGYEKVDHCSFDFFFISLMLGVVGYLFIFILAIIISYLGKNKPLQESHYVALADLSLLV